MKECLMKKFERLKAEYIKTFKAGFLSMCRKIGDELFAIVEELKAEGVSFTDLGLSNDGEYILRSLGMVAKNPMGEHADVIFADAKRVKCGMCSNGCEKTPEKTLTLRGFDVLEINSDGSLSFPEQITEEKAPEQPLSHVTRNVEFTRPNYPEICNKDCPHTQCSSWGIASMQGKPCRNITPTNEQWGKGK